MGFFLTLVIGDTKQLSNYASLCARETGTNTTMRYYDENSENENTLRLIAKDGRSASSLKKSEIDFEAFKKAAAAEYQAITAKINQFFQTQEEIDSYLRLDNFGGKFSFSGIRNDRPDEADLEVFNSAFKRYKASADYDVQFAVFLRSRRSKYQNIIRKTEAEYVEDNYLNSMILPATLYQGLWLSDSVVASGNMLTMEENSYRKNVKKIINELPDDAVLSVVECHT